MSSGIKLGQYIPGQSFIHNLDPRTKIIGCLSITSLVLVDSHWYTLFISLVTIIFAFVISGFGIKSIARALRKLRYILLFSFVFQMILRPGEVILEFGFLSMTKEGIELGLSTTLRMVTAYLSSSLLTMTTPPIKLVSGMEFILLPLQNIGIPIHQISMMISTSLRFLPIIVEEAETIKSAQLSRGAPLHSKNLKLRMKSMTSILVPLLVASLQRANDLAIAMESRCYTGGSSKMRLKQLHFKRNDKWVFGMIIILVVTVIYL